MTETKKPPAWAIIKLQGEDYETVPWRVIQFRETYPDHKINSSVRKEGDTVIGYAWIENPKGDILSDGHSAVAAGRNSAWEMAQTKAVGRALAFFGFGGKHIASAEEMEDFEAEKRESALLDHNAAVRENWDSLVAAKNFLAEENVAAAKEVLGELDMETARLLWRAPTKGGVFTTHERALLKGVQKDAKRDPEGRGV